MLGEAEIRSAAAEGSGVKMVSCSARSVERAAGIVIVATIASGMGIGEADIRKVSTTQYPRVVKRSNGIDRRVSGTFGT